MIRQTWRTNRKLSRCCDSCNRGIVLGARYIEHVASPNHDDYDNPRWWRLAECAACAFRYAEFRPADPNAAPAPNHAPNHAPPTTEKYAADLRAGGDGAF